MSIEKNVFVVSEGKIANITKKHYLIGAREREYLLFLLALKGSDYNRMFTERFLESVTNINANTLYNYKKRYNELSEEEHKKIVETFQSVKFQIHAFKYFKYLLTKTIEQAPPDYAYNLSGKKTVKKKNLDKAFFLLGLMIKQVTESVNFKNLSSEDKEKLLTYHYQADFTYPIKQETADEKTQEILDKERERIMAKEREEAELMKLAKNF